MIGNVLRIVRMAIAKLGNHGFEGIEHVEIGAGIEVGGGQRGRGVEDEQVADSAWPDSSASSDSHGTGNVEDFAFLAGSDGELLHGAWL